MLPGETPESLEQVLHHNGGEQAETKAKACYNHVRFRNRRYPQEKLKESL